MHIKSKLKIVCIILIILPLIMLAIPLPDSSQLIATFSIVAYDSATEELGIAVASRFFSVGSVVPWAKAGIGAVATQSFANTSFGWRGLELLEQGLSAKEALQYLLDNDDNLEQRQIGIVSANGEAVNHTGKQCINWAGGTTGFGYAIQGNILAGSKVISDMENEFLNTNGTLAKRLFKALVAGDRAGGDSRGKQSAALLLVKEGAGYGGYTDRAIDIRVDDHATPIKELERLLHIGEMNYAWNEGWTAFTKGLFEDALEPMERALELGPQIPELWYDHAVINLAAGNHEIALKALEKCIILNPKLKAQAKADSDLDLLHGNVKYEELIK